jgi:hypothetical protein
MVKKPNDVNYEDVEAEALMSKRDDLDAELKALTPDEQRLAKLAEENKNVTPQRYNVTNKNEKALRVVYDFNKQSVAIQPGQTKQGVLLHPSLAERLKKGDLELTAA